MKTKKVLLISIAVLAFIVNGCGDNSGKGKKENPPFSPTKEKPLNISIYLDLSDRLIRNLTPSQKERDLAIVSFITDYFKSKTLGPQILQSKNCIKVFFYPTPNSSDIATLASDLAVDITKYKGRERRVVIDEMKDKFSKNLSSIYDKTIAENNWPGCDIWDFFSNKKVDVQCVRDGFRNILIILTDGYLYDENHKVQNGDSLSWVTESSLKNPNTALIVNRTGLENLEVRILEVNPIDINHRDHLVSVLENWLKGMGVKADNTTVSETDLPINTQTIIKSFLE